MTIVNDLDENFRFLILEVTNQVDVTRNFMRSMDKELFEKIVSRDDYIDNLKAVIENLIFSKIYQDHSLDQKAINIIRAKNIICSNLERIADFCVNIVRQVGYIKKISSLKNFNHEPFFDEVEKCFPLILPVLEEGNLTKALIICEAELNLDRLYKYHFDLAMAGLRGDKTPEDIVTMLFIFRYLERIGDSLLNIGEALLYAILGEKIKIAQFEALRKTISKSGIDESLPKLRYETYWGTRSGCNISRIKSNSSNDGLRTQDGIFKGGSAKKILAEKKNLEKWQQIMPGLTPKIISCHEEGGKAAILVEFLPGLTLDELVLTCDEDVLASALNNLDKTFQAIWAKTMVKASAETDYIAQLLSRLEGIRAVHPLFFKQDMQISGKPIYSIMELISRAGLVEKQLNAPFTVFVHGDCNTNNILLNQENGVISFIDLYRSRQSDYLQDVSVLLVSFFRMPVFAGSVRGRLNWIIEHIFQEAQAFAAKNKDVYFDCRLALGMARSFITSTRFELNVEFAREMFMRGQYILEKVGSLKKEELMNFKFPIDVLFY